MFISAGSYIITIRYILDKGMG